MLPDDQYRDMELVPEGWEQYAAEEPRSGMAFAYAVGAVAVVLAVLIAALALGWRP